MRWQIITDCNYLINNEKTQPAKNPYCYCTKLKPMEFCQIIYSSKTRHQQITLHNSNNKHLLTNKQTTNNTQNDTLQRTSFDHLITRTYVTLTLRAEEEITQFGNFGAPYAANSCAKV